jgi:threonine/homoserine/homoserine lactone efflux protein
MLAYVLPSITYGFAAAVTPGPLAMYLLSQAISAGWRRTIPAAFSPLISDGPVAVLVLAVLSQVPATLVLYLRLLGGAFILYLAFGAWRSWRDFSSEQQIIAESNPNRLLKAAVVNWLNPNPYLGWSIVLGPMVIGGWRQSPMHGIALMLGFYVTMIAVMIGMIYLFASAGTLGPRVRKSLIGLSSMALAGLGFYQLWLGSSILRAAS